MVACLRTTLAILLLSVGLLLSPQAAQTATAEMASRVPADTALYIEWAGHEAIRAGGGRDSVFGKLMANPEFQRMMNAVGQAAGAAVRQTLGNDETQAQMSESIIELVKVLWSKPMAVAVLGAEPSMIGPVPQVVIAVNAGDASAALLERVQGLLAALPPFAVSRDEVVQTTTFKRYDPLVAVRLGVADGVLWIMVGEGTAARILDVQSGAAPALTNSERYQNAIKKIGTEGRTPVGLFHLDVVHTLAAARQIMTAMTGEEAFPPLVETLVAEAGVNDLQSITATEQIAGRGHRHSIYIASPGPKKGLLKLYDAGPVTDDDLLVIPSDATFAKAANLRLSDVYDEAMRIVNAVGEAEPQVPQTVADALAEVERQTGMKLKEDILDLFDDGWVVFDAPSNGGLIVTGVTMVVETKDPEKVDALIRKGLQAFGDMIGSEEAFMVKTYKHGEQAINFINITAGPSPVAPAWAFHKNRLILALYPQIVGQVIDRLASPAAASRSILENPDFVRARKLLPKDCSAIVYIDTAAGVSQLYSVALPAVSMGCSMAQQAGIPLDVSAWPQREVFMRDLFGDVWGTRSDADGVLIVGHGPWPIPVLPAAAFGPALLGAAATFATAQAAPAHHAFETATERPPESPAASEPASQVTGKLQRISVAMQLYALENQERFPPDLETLLAGGNVTPEDLKPPEGLPPFVYLNGQTLKMDESNVLVYCYVDTLDRLRALGYLEGDTPDPEWKAAWVLTLDGSVQRMSEEEFHTALQATKQALGR
ncbi:MAG TPA: DUF3352 domain-containing protein [Phycisphaerae bacterium]|nr:DUF3352 domain-containing protein [Phycisphaerae bacterium]